MIRPSSVFDPWSRMTMSHINNITNGDLSRIASYAPARPVSDRADAQGTSATPSETRADTVDLSDRARFLDALRSNSIVRTDLVDRVRAEIAAGTYDTPERLDQAINALLDDLSAT